MKKLSVVIIGLLMFATPSQANELTQKQQSMIPIAAFAATGDMSSLHIALNEGLDNGLTINEIKEILVQVYAYAGFPRSLNSINEFMAVIKEREEKGIKDTLGEEGKALGDNVNKYEYGEKVQTELIGAPNKAAYQDFAPAIDAFLKEHLFADIFARGILTYQEREIVTISILSVLKGTDAQLTGHLNIALNTGLTETQIKELLQVLKKKVSKKAASNTSSLFNNILDKRK